MMQVNNNWLTDFVMEGSTAWICWNVGQVRAETSRSEDGVWTIGAVEIRHRPFRSDLWLEIRRGGEILARHLIKRDHKDNGHTDISSFPFGFETWQPSCT